ncbi:HalOD1 output domain-containing protein [Halosimplex amylolyticum]|uniref:HalOD1 output domain-containing protein n=1 Tax=Halosimplex amylolyticum TaxID=3396616 RepID=UPI003F55B8B9
MVGTDGGAVTVSRTYDPANRKPSVAVLGALADVKNTHPAALSLSLHDYVDADSLDRLLTRKRGATVSFPMDGYSVTVTPDEVVLSVA